MKLKIRQPELNPRTCQVWLDDHEVTTGLTGLGIAFKKGSVTTAVLQITVDELDIDAEALAVLHAHVEQQGEPEDAEPKPVGVAG